ncbi:hypothetical protein V6N11_069454 [Hibiscus sabdariffa]|uniref:Uncharacterized protein n=2 Tax=Hibiscus sabdariffa TaxID=183260 RepID=A0ABR2Q2S6_9ROSI
MENLKENKSQPKRGLWKPEEDLVLKSYVETYGEGNWTTVSKRSGMVNERREKLQTQMEELLETKHQTRRDVQGERRPYYPNAQASW